ncbi:MAG: hypothetical protein HS107_12745 [Thermoflexaceae bacterium]|nr:hypothetical protein [Thermoflexaceae bacterium]
MHQLARVRPLVADDAAGGAVELAKDGDPMAPEDAVDRGGGKAELVGDAVWARPRFTAEAENRLHHLGTEGRWRPSRALLASWSPSSPCSR